MTVMPLLANKEQFKIDLFDLEEGKFYVKLSEDMAERLISKIKNEYGSLLSFSRQKNFLFPTFYGWLNRREFPLSILKGLQKEFEIPLPEITTRIISIKSGHYPSIGGNLSKPIRPQFPIRINKEWVRIIAHLMGDGMVSKSKEGQISAAYFNQNKLLLKQFVDDVEKVFNIKINKIKKNKNTPFVRLPTPSGLILLEFADNFGSKACRIPNFIKRSTKSFQREFVRSFFDDEAYVKYNPPHRYIEMALANKLFIEDLIEILGNFGIVNLKVYYKKVRGFDIYYFYIRGSDNLLKYSQGIGFNHSNKQKKLSKIINDPGRSSYLHGQTKEKIIDLIKQKVTKSSHMAKILKRKLVTVNHFLKLLEKEGRIKCVKRENKYRIYEVKND